MKVLQLPLETLKIAEGEAKTRYLAPVVSRVELYLPRFERLAAQNYSNTSSPCTIWLVWGLNIIDCMDRILSIARQSG